VLKENVQGALVQEDDDDDDDYSCNNIWAIKKGLQEKGKQQW
jgi:hypothetical protein